MNIPLAHAEIPWPLAPRWRRGKGGDHFGCGSRGGVLSEETATRADRNTSSGHQSAPNTSGGNPADGRRLPSNIVLAAAKTMWDGKRRVLIGWIPRRTCSCGLVTGGCTLLLPREWYLLPDGAPPRARLRSGCCLWKRRHRRDEAQVFEPVMSTWKIKATAASAMPEAGRSAMANVARRPGQLLSPHRDPLLAASRAAILLRGQSADTAYGYKTPLDTGYCIYLDPGSGTVSLRPWYEWDQRGPINEIAYSFSKDQPTLVEMFLDGDILEVFLDGRRSLVGRRSGERCRQPCPVGPGRSGRFWTDQSANYEVMGYVETQPLFFWQYTAACVRRAIVRF